MGLKFRRRKKIFPGVYLNFSATGISTTVGFPGLSLNFNKKGTYLNTGIPGSGIYDRKKVSTNTKDSDSTLIGETWAKVNKDGSRDKRFKDNYKIPIIKYGAIEFISSSGVNEEFVFSKWEAAKSFVNSYKEFVSM